MEGQSEANQTTQNQAIVVFTDVKTAVRTVRSPVGQVPDSADLKVGAKKVWMGSVDLRFYGPRAWFRWIWAFLSHVFPGLVVTLSWTALGHP